MSYLHNCWYAAAWATEFGRSEIISRRILDQPIAIFKSNGTLSALHNLCPHRFAPLDRGKMIEGGLQCGYHGLVFDGSGACVFNPQGDKLSAVRVRAFEVREAYGLIWIWMGEREEADPAALPDLSFFDRGDPRALTPGYTHVDANYELLNDNILDLIHVDFLHSSTLKQGSLSKRAPKVRSNDGRVSISWEVIDVSASLLNRPFVGDTHLDILTEVVWEAAGNMKLFITMRPTNDAEGPVLHVQGAHLMTPETATSTHYFHCATRDFGADDVTLTAARKEILRIAFDVEDKPMLEAVQISMNGRTDLMAMRPALLAGDGGAVSARRALAERIKQEHATKAVSGASLSLVS